MYFKSMELAGIEHQKDTTIFHHVQNVAPVMADAELLRQTTDNGWTNNRSMQLIGEIPDVVFFNHPEFYDDDNALRRWLASEEGQMFSVGSMKHKRGIVVK